MHRHCEDMRAGRIVRPEATGTVTAAGGLSVAHRLRGALGALLAANALCLVLCSGGCAASAGRSPYASEASPVVPLTPSQKRTAIATSFPAEVPVPAGDFTRAEAQGDDAWDYVVEVDTAYDELVAWYRDAYVGREWELLSAEPFERGAEAGVVMRFRKANAESSVTVYRNGDVGPVRAGVTVGIGTPVLQTQ